jgi:hypothetical protein
VLSFSADGIVSTGEGYVMNERSSSMARRRLYIAIAVLATVIALTVPAIAQAGNSWSLAHRAHGGYGKY